MQTIRRVIVDGDLHDIAVGILVFVLTCILAEYYVAGDQIGYHLAFSSLRGVDPELGFSIYRSFISTGEFVHYLFAYVGSNLSIPKNLFFAFLNGILALMIAQIFRALKVYFLLTLFFVLTNYYIVVMYFSAERLKVAIIVLLFGVFFVKNLYARWLVLAVAVATHVTTTMLFAGSVLNSIWDGMFSKNRGPSIGWPQLVGLAGVGIGFVYVFYDYAQWKFFQYYAMADNDLLSLVPLAVCVAMSLFYAEDKKLAIFDFIPLIVAFALLGGSRVNMFAYIIFLRHALPVKNGLNLGVLGTSAYFGYKTIFFVRDFILTGQGF